MWFLLSFLIFLVFPILNNCSKGNKIKVFFRGTVNVYTESNHYSKDVSLLSDTPMAATSKSRVVFEWNDGGPLESIRVYAPNPPWWAEGSGAMWKMLFWKFSTRRNLKRGVIFCFYILAYNVYWLTTCNTRCTTRSIAHNTKLIKSF